MRKLKMTLAEISAYLMLVLLVIFVLLPQINKAKEGMDKDRKRLFPSLPEPVSLDAPPKVDPVILENDGRTVHVYEHELGGKSYYLFFYGGSFQVQEKK